MNVSIGQRLPAADTEMLAAERLGPHVSSACPLLWVMDGPCPSLGELIEHLRPRLPRKMRQRVRRTPWRLTRPLWVDSPGWSIEDHVHLVDDPRFASDEGWLDFISEMVAVRLDCARAPWMMWLIPHREESRFALVSLLHHALADGHSGVQLLLLSAGPPGHDAAQLAADDGSTTPARSSALRSPRLGAVREAVALSVRDVADSAGVACGAARALLDAVCDPRAAWVGMREGCAALGELAVDLRRSPPALPWLNGVRGARQRVGHFDMTGGDVRCVTERLNCFPNDIFLSLVGAGVGGLLAHMGVATEGVEIQVWVPVNIGGPRARATLGNHFSGARVAVPIGPMGAVERLRRVRVASRSVSASRLVAAGRLVTRLENALPAPALRWAAQIALSPHTMNLIASHMVVPPLSRPFPGRRLRDVRAWTFLPEGHALSFAAQSLNGRLSVNYLADEISLPDHGLLVGGMEEQVGALVEAAAACAIEADAGAGVRQLRSAGAAHLHVVVREGELG